jgi:hypothetical protein
MNKAKDQKFVDNQNKPPASMVFSHQESSPVIPPDLRPRRKLQTPCYSKQTLSSTQGVVIYYD